MVGEQNPQDIRELTAWLEADDAKSRAMRATRLRDLLDILPVPSDGLSFLGGEQSVLCFDEIRRCYLDRSDMAVVLLCLAYVERELAAQLYAAGWNRATKAFAGEGAGTGLQRRSAVGARVAHLRRAGAFAQLARPLPRARCSSRSGSSRRSARPCCSHRTDVVHGSGRQGERSRHRASCEGREERAPGDGADRKAAVRSARGTVSTRRIGIRKRPLPPCSGLAPAAGAARTPAGFGGFQRPRPPASPDPPLRPSSPPRGRALKPLAEVHPPGRQPVASSGGRRRASSRRIRWASGTDEIKARLARLGRIPP